MKLWMLLLALFTAVLSAQADSYSTTVGTNPVCILPASGTADADATWVAGVTNSVGALVSYRGRAFMCLTSPGASTTNGPAGSGRDIATGDGYVWRPVKTKPRQHLVIVNCGTNGITISEGTTVAAKAGVYLGTVSPSFQFEAAPRGAIWAVADAGTSVVSVYED